MWTYLNDTEPRARRPYRCCLCGLRIRQGARHIARRGFWEGDEPTTYRYHASCQAATVDWDEADFETHDEAEFRCYVLGLPLLPDPKPKENP